jgi:hypothetical protein
VRTKLEGKLAKLNGSADVSAWQVSLQVFKLPVSGPTNLNFTSAASYLKFKFNLKLAPGLRG